jgi:predicted DsbA family dithiol-disulfide isomerase
VIVPLFALANAGVDLRGGVLQDALQSPLTWGVALGLVAGKPIGIGLASLMAIRFRLGALPQGVGRAQVFGGGALSGMGFSVSLLIVGLAFESERLREEATIGVLLACALSAITGWITFRLAVVLFGERTASLPMFLDRPVDAARDHIRGPVDAPLTLVEYGDFECPFCAAATSVIRDLHARFGDELRYVFRNLPLEDVHPHAELTAEAAEAAGVQGKFWEMYDLLFQHQDNLEFEDLIGYAATLELDVGQFADALTDGRFAGRVRDDVASAEASGARGTPTFFIGERRHLGPWDTETLARALEGSRSMP